MPSPLEVFLHQFTSGQGTMTPEMYAHFGGDDILKQLQKFDPNAGITETSISGGEGGEGQMGKRLDFDITKMPKSKMPDGSMHELHGLAPSNMTQAGLLNKDYKWNDDNYGEVTDSKNVFHKHEGIDKYAPLIGMMIAMGAPIAGAGLAAAGIGGGAGFTSAVTGGAAGLGAGSVPGAMGAGSFAAGEMPWLDKLATKPSTVQTVGKGVSNLADGGDFDFMSVLPALLGMSGMDPKIAFAIRQAMAAQQGKKPGVGDAVNLAQLFGKP